jgi:hypothetical protein
MVHRNKIFREDFRLNLDFKIKKIQKLRITAGAGLVQKWLGLWQVQQS